MGLRLPWYLVPKARHLEFRKLRFRGVFHSKEQESKPLQSHLEQIQQTWVHRRYCR